MKNYVCIAMLALAFVACGDDDEATEPSPALPSTLLVEGSPWTFQSMEINNITFNGPEFTIQEADTYITGRLQNTMWDFNSNNTGSLTTSDGEGFSFDYNFINQEGGLDFTTIRLTVADVEVFRLKNIVVTETSLVYTTDEECFGEIELGDVCVQATYTYN